MFHKAPPLHLAVAASPSSTAKSTAAPARRLHRASKSPDLVLTASTPGALRASPTLDLVPQLLEKPEQQERGKVSAHHRQGRSSKAAGPIRLSKSRAILRTGNYMRIVTALH